MGELMTMEEIKSYLQLHEMTIYRWVKTGAIPGFKVGGRWRFIRSEIEAWIKSKSVKE